MRKPKFPKTPILFAALLSLGAAAFPFGRGDVREMTFGNGLRLYLVEDSSRPLVTMELRVGAGYDSQTERTAGYPALCARLRGMEISAGSASRRLVCAPADAERSMRELASSLEPLELGDGRLRAEISEERANAGEYARSAAGFINAAMEARLFPESPWRHESSADPRAFSRNSAAESRTILAEVGRLYSPDNARLYVSGNITAQSAESFALRAFGKFARGGADPHALTAVEKAAAALAGGGGGRRFVLHDAELSPEMSQVVATWTGLSADEADVAATAMDEPFSALKEELTSDPSLGIRGAEYVNAASVRRRGSTRLVVQTLLERTDAAAAEQVRSMLGALSRGARVSADALAWEVRQYAAEFERRSDSSEELLAMLADQHDLALDGGRLFGRLGALGRIGADGLNARLSAEEPFVFVLMNSAVYARNAKELEKAGFAEVTRGNGAWWTNGAYGRLMLSHDSMDTDANPERAGDAGDGAAEDTFESARRFVERNRRDFASFTLSNGIPAVLKRTGTSEACLSITISGGELMFAREHPGLAAVFADALAVNIRGQLDAMHAQGLTRGSYGVGARTDSVQSVITVTFSGAELAQTLGAVSGALIYGDITPALADGICYDERTQWRLRSGSAEFQQLAHAMRKIFAGTDAEILYREAAERPEPMEFTKILRNYPKVVDAARISLVVAGDFDPNGILEGALDMTLGSIGRNPLGTEIAGLGKPDLGGYVRRAKLRHVFLTDVSADKAGPMPATLVPTTKFLDPATFILPAPEKGTAEAARFNALCHALAARIEREARKAEDSTRVKFVPEQADAPFARFVAANVGRTGALDRLFTECAAALTRELGEIVRSEEEELSEIEGARLVSLEKNALLSEIEGGWLVRTLGGDGTAKRTAELVQAGARLGRADQYLADYAAVSSASAADYMEIAGSRLSALPPVRIYSADSKK